MQVLLDEQLPRQLGRYLIGHTVRTVQQESWAGLKNGVLLSRAEAAGYSVFITGDQNLQHQQNVSARKLGIVVLAASINALEDLLPLVVGTLRAIDSIKAGEVIRVTKLSIARATSTLGCTRDAGLQWS